MVAATIVERIRQASPRAMGRITGGVYLLFFATAILGAAVAPGINGPGAGDAAATATNIVLHQASFRLGWDLTLVSTACYVALIALFYQLFRPVSRSLAVLAAFFGLVGCAVTAFASLFQLAPQVILGGKPYLAAFDGKQLQALALLFLNLNVQIGSIALVFFGVFQIAIGYLIFKSDFLPRMLGVLMALAGLGWLTVLVPPLANQLIGGLEGLGILAEASLMLWLLSMGVNSQRWNAQEKVSLRA